LRKFLYFALLLLAANIDLFPALAYDDFDGLVIYDVKMGLVGTVDDHLRAFKTPQDYDVSVKAAMQNTYPLGKAPAQLKLVKEGKAIKLFEGDKGKIVGKDSGRGIIQIQLLSGKRKGQKWWMFATYFLPKGMKPKF
jgi:hypothetical protein